MSLEWGCHSAEAGYCINFNPESQGNECGEVKIILPNLCRRLGQEKTVYFNGIQHEQQNMTNISTSTIIRSASLCYFPCLMRLFIL